VHQRLEPGVAVRLYDGDHALLRALSRGGEHGTDLGRMVGVIVDHDRSADLAYSGEAAFDAVELLEAADDLLVRNAKLHRDGDCGERILDVVPAGHRHMDSLERAPLAV